LDSTFLSIDHAELNLERREIESTDSSYVFRYYHYVEGSAVGSKHSFYVFISIYVFNILHHT